MGVLGTIPGGRVNLEGRHFGMRTSTRQRFRAAMKQRDKGAIEQWS